MRERGDVTGYLLFFLRAVAHQSEDAVARASSLVALRERHYAQSRLDRSRVSGLVPLTPPRSSACAASSERWG